jgi:hypothetical protein
VLDENRLKDPVGIKGVLKSAPLRYRKRAAEKVLGGYLPENIVDQVGLLAQIAETLPEYAQRAAGLMLEKIEGCGRPDDLVGIITDTDIKGNVMKRANEKLFAESILTKDQLITIAKKVHESYVDAVYTRLLSFDLTNDEITKVIKYAPPPFRDILSRRMLLNNPNDRDLLHVWSNNPLLRERVLERYRPDAGGRTGEFASFLRITSGNSGKQTRIMGESGAAIDGEDTKIIPQLRLDVWTPDGPDPVSTDAATKLFDDEDSGEFTRIYEEPLMQRYFRDNKSSLTYAETFSITLAAMRYVADRLTADYSDRNLGIALKKVTAQREKFKRLHILDRDTTLIHFTNDEYNAGENMQRFDNKDVISLAKNAGVKKIIDENMTGPKYKGKILDAIRNSRGPTTIWFSGHGEKQVWYLGSGPEDRKIADETGQPWTISFVELGDALLERGDASDVIIVADACLQYNFMKNLEEYMQKMQPDGTRVGMPVMVTAANKNMLAYSGAAFEYMTYGDRDTQPIFNTGSVFLDAVSSAHKGGAPLTGADILQIEPMVYHMMDPSFHMPDQDTGVMIELSSNVHPGEKAGLV